ncbi:MAG: TonB-dependent receptor [Ignavibacteriaceae bacterium]|jgi:vitamin B12 transporter|nr:TonB-dependent receptor [Ignavibacteriaceae bacterium]
MKHLFYLFLFITSISFAQDAILKTKLDEVVVTANRTNTPYYAVGSSLTVIKPSEIIIKSESVVDLLREVPGLSITEQGGKGKLATVFVRGSNSSHLLVFVDGAKMNDPANASNLFDFSSLSSFDIDRIEIVRGPQSTIYGSDAMAGVINIITKTGSKVNQTRTSFEGGTNNYFNINLTTSGDYSGLKYFAGFSKIQTDGISSSSEKYGNTEKDKFMRNSLSANINYDFLNSYSIGVMYKATKTESGLDQDGMYGDDPNFTYDNQEQIFTGKLKGNFFDSRLSSHLAISFVRRISNTVDLVDDIRPSTSSDNYTNSGRFKYEFQNNLSINEKHLLTFGIETEEEEANTHYISNSMWGPYESSFPKEKNRTTGIYFQEQATLFNSLFVSAGFRYDNNQKFGSVATYRLAPAYFINQTNTKIKGSFGTGFKSPSLFYLFDPMFGNPDLKPEESIGWDFGFEQFLLNGDVSFGVTYFSINFTNMFGFDANYKTINIAEAKSRGIEAFATANILDNLKINANYTFTQTKDNYQTSEDYGLELLRRPKHSAYIALSSQITNSLIANISARFVGKKWDKDYNAYPAIRVQIPDYTIFNLGASYKIIDQVSISARVENLFDKYYEEILYYGTNGRTFYAGVNFNI